MQVNEWMDGNAVVNYGQNLPARTRQKSMITLHVQERNGTVNGAEQIRPHRVHVAHEQATIRPTPDRQRRWLADI